MADVTLAVQKITNAGVDESFTAIDATDTYFVRNTAGVLLHFKNTGGSASTVTLVTPNSVAGFAIADQQVTIPATTGDRMVAALPTSVFNDGQGFVTFTQDQASGVTVAVVKAG